MTMNRRSRSLVVLVSVALLSATGCATERGGTTGPGGQMMRYTDVCRTPDLGGPDVVDVLEMDMARMRSSDSAGRLGRMMLHTSPAAVSTGTVTFGVHNGGRRVHELLVAPLTGSTVGSRAVDRTGVVDEADVVAEVSEDCAAGEGDGILPGGTSWATVHLQPGEYELFCNEPGHYRSGMYQRFTVR